MDSIDTTDGSCDAKNANVERVAGYSSSKESKRSVNNSLTADEFQFSPLDLNDLRRLQTSFVVERDWTQYHTPRNLLCALVGEVGELAEIFQWKGEQVTIGASQLTSKERANLNDELSDVLLYLVRLAQVCKVDLSEAVKAKIEKNSKKYPADLVRGKWAKYTEYKEKHTVSTEENQDK
ncbi:dCTP pyrophosphatase 1-like [Convolutriloba macropyga]|uniref:dCTP pyrophosphatase 1-like n=1 Tax=Convolutriloba macropyga TaxID=536237 RepID=UPI003F5245FA